MPKESTTQVTLPSLHFISLGKTAVRAYLNPASEPTNIQQFMNSAAVSTFNLITSAINDAEATNGLTPCSMLSKYHDHHVSDRLIRRHFETERVQIGGSCSSPPSSSGDDIGEQYNGNDETSWNRVTFSLRQQGIDVPVERIFQLDLDLDLQISAD
jgi:hypothetical protein